MVFYMKKNGFTLVEILAVVFILGILVTIAMTAVIPRINQAKKETFIIDAQNILKVAEDLFVEKQALNELPKNTSDSSNDIIFKYNYSYYGKPKYNAYAIDIGKLRKIMDIDSGYKGIVLFADYYESDYTKAYINIYNKDFALKGFNEDPNKCIKNGKINMCFYSSEYLNMDLLVNQNQIEYSLININDLSNSNNKLFIRLDPQ